jgi:hypothetical protein
MNSTKTTLAIAAILISATLVVGGTSAAMTTGHSAFAWKQDSYKNKRGDDSYKNKRGDDSYKNKRGDDSYKNKRGDDSYKKVRQADGNYGNGNTNTAQILKQNAKADKFSIVEQNGENSICTHPSGTCTSQSNQPLEVP